MYPFPSLEPVCSSLSSSNCCFLIYIQVSLHTKRQVRWSDIPTSWRIVHSLLWSAPSKALAQLMKKSFFFFLEFICFFYNPMDVGNLTYGSSGFCKSSLYIWKFSVHILLKPSLKDFEHYLASVWHLRQPNGEAQNVEHQSQAPYISPDKNLILLMERKE